MTEKTFCSFVTRRGRPCRNTAQPDTDPPACARHRRPASNAPADAPTRKTTNHPAAHLYFPNRPADSPQGQNPASDLRAEIDLVRDVLRRLLALLDSTEGLSPEELRRVSGLVFSGARTVAHLMARQSARADDANEWLASALAEMGERYSLNL